MTGVDNHLWWIASRSAGIVAMAAVAASVLIGLTLANGLGGPPARRRALVALHEHAAVTGLVAIAVHALTLLGDAWLKPGLAGLAVPFALGYRTLFTGLGIVGAYLAAILGLSFYVRRRIGARRWRSVHRATPVVYALALVHALGAGSDAALLRVPLLATAVPVTVLLARRVLRPRRAPVRRRPAVEAARP